MHTNCMKKLLGIILSAVCACATVGVTSGFTTENNSRLTSGCKSAYLIDYNSGECIYKENETVRVPIASVCKVMTLTLCFDAIAEGRLSVDSEVTVSENAAGMGGSQVFLGSGLTYKVSNLIKSIVVCSANDSCVALSETIAGGEEEFVAKMNKKASDLGCTDTLFANCTGLPRETQYSCAKDVALMFKNLLSYDDYFNYSKIWLEDFEHPDNRLTTMTNTNKLIKKYSCCDGGKTGFTNEAGFCLAATAKKNDLRLISVVLGGKTSDDRFESTMNLFDYGFANYKNKIVLDKDVNLNDEFAVKCGKKDSCSVRPERNCYIFSPINNSVDITYNVISYEIKAPVICGQEVGKVEVFKNGVLADTVKLVAAEDVEKANYKDFFIKDIELWNI